MNLVIKAGRKAYDLIQKEGLQADMVHGLAGAAGGPKWIVLAGLDQFLFGQWFAERQKPLYLLGSSIGTWRFGSAMATPNPIDGLNAFRDIYFDQHYSSKVTKAEVTAAAHRLIKVLFTKERIDHILQHPFGRLQITTAKASALAKSENPFLLSLSMLNSMIANAISRTALQMHYQRVKLEDPRDRALLFDDNKFNTAIYDLTSENFIDAILASSAIPMAIEPIKAIKGAPKGIYRDGGIIDYHMVQKYQCPEGKVVLIPHFFEQFKQGWFDKHLSYRKPNPKDLENAVLIYPSKKFIQSLPNNKVPDRKDFTTFSNEDRNHHWGIAYQRSFELANEFKELIDNGKIAETIQSL